MKRKGLSLMVSAVFVCLLLSGNTSFAQNSGADIPAYDQLIYKPVISSTVLNMVKNNFSSIITELEKIKDEFTLTPIELAQYDKAIDMIETRKNRLESIDVFFIDETSGGGATRFIEVYNFYKDDVGLKLEDLVNKASQATTDGRKNELIQAFRLLPPTVLTEPVRIQLESLIDTNAFKAYRGANVVSRISILSVFVDPNSATLPDPTVEERTVVVIATDSPTP